MEHFIEVAHTEGILTSHRANANNPCEALRRVLAQEYGIAEWMITVAVRHSYPDQLTLYAVALPSFGETNAGARGPEYTPIKAYVHGDHSAERAARRW